MQSFIAQTWEHLSKEIADPSSLRCIVPSIRAGNFLRQTIQKQAYVGFLPEIIPIELFIQEISDLQIIDELPLLFECYQVYLSKQPELPKDDFDTFSSWATVLLADFNEIDRYLVPPESFFSYLAGIQEINHWSLSEAPTEMMLAFLNFWNELPSYYKDLRHALVKKNLGYQGMVYREATEQLAFYLEAKGNRPHAFIGFNALNNAEQQIFQEFLSHGGHYVYWDADKRFIEDKTHSASLFMRRYFSSWPYYEKASPKFISDHYGEPKEIQLIQASNPLDQVKEIGLMLQELDPTETENTAIVLADEQLLLPLLNSLPDNIQNVNITMGVSLRFQPLTIWLLHLLDLHLKQPKTYYYKSLFSVLEHPICSLVLKDPQRLVDQMTKQNIIAVSYEELCEAFSNEDPQVIRSLFAPWPSDIESSFRRINAILVNFLEETNDIHRTTANKLIEVIVQMQNMQARYQSISSIEALRNVLRQLSAKARIDFKGDAYKGLQIMGVLESRALDFERIIMASVNEGFLPSGKNAPSYITNDMKLQYGLPSFFEKDAIFTYHFYRLLQRAKKISLLYTAVGGGFQSKEESRLIKQLRTGHHKSALKERTIEPHMKPQRSTIKTVSKTPEIIASLQALGQKQYSPSALISYIRNPIDFYVQKVLGIRQAVELEEDIALNTLGTVVHGVIEELYLPLVGTDLTVEALKELKPKVDQTLTKHSLEELGKHYLDGKNRIVFEVSKQYVNFAIESDLRHLKAGSTIHLLALEEKLEAQLEHKTAGIIQLGGLADRIDRLNGQLRIIDYKTGKVEPGQLQLTDWAPLTQDYKYSKAFQVLMYAFMYWQQKKELPDLAGIISFRQQTKDFMPFGWKNAPRGKADTRITQDIMSSFREELLVLFDEIYNPELPFTEKEIE